MTHHLEALYAKLLYPTDGTRGLAPKTAYEVHLVIRGALGDAVRRDVISRNVALVAHAPRLRSIPKVEQQAWTTPELQQLLHAAAGHCEFPALWVAAFTGMRRNEFLGLRWEDFDAAATTLSGTAGSSRSTTSCGKRGARRPTLAGASISTARRSVVSAWRGWQTAEQPAAQGTGLVVEPAPSECDGDHLVGGA